jgi:hypothetical protein
MDESRERELETRLDEMERRLERYESKPGGREAAYWSVLHAVFPVEARKHLKAAGREQLLAARAYLDQWIAKMDDDAGEERPAGRETIEVR